MGMIALSLETTCLDLLEGTIILLYSVSFPSAIGRKVFTTDEQLIVPPTSSDARKKDLWGCTIGEVKR